MSEAKKLSRADELNALGAKLFGQNHIEAARLHFLGALSVEPHHQQALQNLGAALRQQGHYAAAETVAKRSVVVSNGNPFCRSNLGVSQLNLWKFNEALLVLRDVVVDMPDSAPSWHNYGLILYMMGRHEEALAAFDKSIALNNLAPQLLSDRALTLLALGRLTEGLTAYEARWDLLTRGKIWALNLPEWQGEEVAGAHILVHHEQGFGDSLMLSRFIPILKAKGARITLAAPAELVRLFHDSFPFVRVVDIMDEALDWAAMGFDYHTPMLSMMRHLGIVEHSDITSPPYLHTAAKLSVKLPPGRKIGLCWASGDHGPATSERRRVVSVTAFLPLLEEPRLALVSLQKGEEARDLVANGLEGLVFDASPWLEDFAATAAFIRELDLVISVDSAVAHLAGAMGKPTIVLSPYTRCWRWWGKDNGKPWYDKMAILSQEKDGTWGKALEEAIDFVWMYCDNAEKDLAST